MLNLSDAVATLSTSPPNSNHFSGFFCCSSKWLALLAAMACCASIQPTQRYIDVNDEKMRRTMESV